MRVWHKIEQSNVIRKYSFVVFRCINSYFHNIKQNKETYVTFLILSVFFLSNFREPIKYNTLWQMLLLKYFQKSEVPLVHELNVNHDIVHLCHKCSFLPHWTSSIIFLFGTEANRAIKCDSKIYNYIFPIIHLSQNRKVFLG